MRAPSLSSTAGPLMLALMLGAAGCSGPRSTDITGSIPDDYRVNHPIHVTRSKSSIDILPGGGPGGLTDRQVQDIQSFASEWQKRGRGALTVQVPVGADAATETQSSYALREIRKVLAAMGVSGGKIAIVRYPADGPGHLAPVRLEFAALDAKVPHECGQWPDDLGFSDPGGPNRNKSYWNYGCATQQNLAAQVEDPEDFIRPRGETAADGARRANVLQKYRRGESTNTSYPQDTVETQ